MTTTIVIFFITVLSSFFMIYFRAWQLQTGKIEFKDEEVNEEINLDYKTIEKNFLLVIKSITFGLVLLSAKYWFILTTRIKQWYTENKPKIHEKLNIKIKEGNEFKPTFLRRAIFELKIRLKRMKYAIKKKHEVDFEK